MSRKRISAGAAAGGLVAALVAAPQPAAAAPFLSQPIVQPGQNLTITDPAATFNAAATVQVAVGNCAPKLAAPAATGPWSATVVNKSSTSVTFTVPATVTAGANGTVKAYNACIYEGATATTSNVQATVPFAVGAMPMVSPGSGISGGGNQLTVTANPATPIFTAAFPVAASFTTGPCPAALGATGNLTAANVVKPTNFMVTLTVPPGVVAQPGPSATTYNLCLYDGSSATGALLSWAPYSVTLIGLNPSSGSYLNQTGVTATSTSPFLTGVTSPAVLLVPGMGPACPFVYSTAAIGPVTPVAISGPGVRRLTTNRAAITIPPLPLSGNQPTNYQVCFYNGATPSSTLLGTSSYTAAVVANPTAVIPAAGPAAGGNQITVLGTDFPQEPGRITATLGGLPLTNIQTISDKAFTATAPAHTADQGVTLVVTTSAGTRALPGAYSYLNPIKISPNTAPSTAPTVDLDVQGQNFMSINFGTAGAAGRIFLVRGVYDGTNIGNGVRGNGPIAECGNVLPIADDELICTLQLNRRLGNDGLVFDTTNYTNNVSDVGTIAGSRVISSDSGAFKRDDAGQPISQGGNMSIAPGAIVTSVLSPNKATISAPATMTTMSMPATIGGSAVRTFTNQLTFAAGSTTAGIVNGAFTRADVGRVFSNTSGLAPGTTIVAVAPGGSSATLSSAANLGTTTTLQGVATDGTPNITATSLSPNDTGSIIGPNTLGIPVGTMILSAGTGTATLSVPVTGTATGTLQLNHPIGGSLYAGAPVPDGSYNLVMVSNGAPDAAQNDPDYYQTDVTSSSTFTVSSF
jgi:hypothetical protein